MPTENSSHKAEDKMANPVINKEMKKIFSVSLDKKTKRS